MKTAVRQTTRSLREHTMPRTRPFALVPLVMSRLFPISPLGPPP